MRIAHIGAWGRNWGDRAIQWAMRQAIGYQHEWTYYDCQHHWFDHADALLAGQVDVVVIGGGGLLWDKPELESISGWQWQVSPEFIDALTVPVIVWGIGWTRFDTPEDKTGTHPMFRETLLRLAAKAEVFTVRDEQTADIMRFFIGKRPEVVSDPALGAEYGIEREPKGRVAICWAMDKHAWRWQSIEDEARAYGILVRAIEVLGLDHYEVPHVPGDLGAGPRDATLEGVQAWASLYAPADIVVSTRKHGMLVPATMGIPVVGMGSLPEVGWLAADMGADKICETDGSGTMQAILSTAEPISEKRLAKARADNVRLGEIVNSFKGT